MIRIKTLVFISIFLFYGFIQPVQKKYRSNRSPQLNNNQKLQLKQIGDNFNQKKRLDFNTLNKWKTLVGEIFRINKSVDINSLIQDILTESYKENKDALKFYAERIKYLDELKKKIRNHVRDLKNKQNRMQKVSGQNKFSIQLKDFTPAIIYSKKIVQNKGRAKLKTKILSRIHYVSKTVLINLSFLIRYRKQLEGKLKTVDSDAQLANIDLQNQLQKQQQTIQMMNNTKKSLTSTAMAVIRKIGG